MSDKDSVEGFFEQLRAAQAAMDEAAKAHKGNENPQPPPKSAEKAKPSLDDYKEGLLTALANLSPEEVKALSISTTVLVMSLIGRRKVRKALEALGMDSKAAKVVSVGALWGAWSIAANATIGNEYASYLARERLYAQGKDSVEG